MLIKLFSVVRRPICPTFVHDDTTRIIICTVGLICGLLILYRIAKYFNK